MNNKDLYRTMRMVHSKAYSMGYVGYLEHMHRQQNPFNATVHHDEYFSWDNGWMEGRNQDDRRWVDLVTR